MSAHEHGIGVGVLIHRSFEATGQILLKGSVLNDGDAQSIKEPEHALALATGNALDLLDVVNLKTGIRALLALHQQGHQDGPLRVSVDTAPCAVLKGCQEQWSAGRGIQIEGLADIVAFFSGVLLGRPLNHEYVLGLHQLLLDTRGSDKDVIAMANGRLFGIQHSLEVLAQSAQGKRKKKKPTPPPVPVTHPQL